jgi:hypothetical protein
MTDLDPTGDEAGGKGKDKASPEEKRVLATVAKALFRSTQEVAAGPLSKEARSALSKEERKEAMDKSWKENRKVYLKEAKRLVRQLNLSPENVTPRGKKRKAAAAGGSE